MRELLIRYLLGELDEIEHDEVQRRLNESPELRRELTHLRSCFAATCQDDETSAGPPQDLAARVTQRIASGEDSLDQLPIWSDARRAEAAAPPGVLGWSLADLTVAGGVVMAVSMLLFPALSDSRNATRRNVCANNLHQMWLCSTMYAENNGRYYPRIAPHENSGMFAMRLVEGEYATRNDMALMLVCPAASLAESVRSGKAVIQTPTSAELELMGPRELAEVKRYMSPFFDYRMPYRVGDTYVYIKDERSPYIPVFADRAGPAHNGPVSPNHDGSIIQVVLQDGRVRALDTRYLSSRNDDISFNSDGLNAAGNGRQDVVLGRTESTPAFTRVRAGR